MEYELRVRDLDEVALLARIFPLLPAGGETVLGPGDDAAVVVAPDGRVVVSTDVLVEGRHFRRDWGTADDVGWRAAAQNLADIAAMGARPTSLVVALVAPGDLAVAWVEGLARGLAAACAPHGVGVVGGDLSGGEQVVVSVTVHGSLDGREPVLRSGACPGDVLAHAGVLGRSAAGLAALGAGRTEHADDLVGAYLRPTPPLGAGLTASRHGATAMIDVSDGLVRDAGRLAAASGVCMDIESTALGDALAVLEAPAAALGSDALEWVLTGGEDHGMLATFPGGGALPEGFRRIGSVLEAGAAQVLVDGEPWHGGVGWDHFGS